MDKLKNLLTKVPSLYYISYMNSLKPLIELKILLWDKEIRRATNGNEKNVCNHRLHKFLRIYRWSRNSRQLANEQAININFTLDSINNLAHWLHILCAIPFPILR